MSGLRVAFVRPRLGVGGAERLVLDAALELADRGHDVTIVAPGRDGEAAFGEVAAGRVRLLRINGPWPDSILGRLRLPCALLRTLAAFHALSREPTPDVLVSDVAAHVIPLLRRRGVPVLHYGHFPDRELTLSPRRGLYELYRAPLDRLEERGLAAADTLVVNSRFSERMFRALFPALLRRPIEVLHPGVSLPREAAPMAADGEPMLLCFGRIDPRKNLRAAIEVLAQLRAAASSKARPRLVIAGHHDARLAECRDTLAALRREVAARGLEAAVRFELSPEEPRRLELLAECRALLYTPEEEHFGIVPLEAMAAGRPVVASRLGGPAETVVEGETGFLVEPTASEFARALSPLLADVALARRMGMQARGHVERRFSRRSFGDRLEELVRATARLGGAVTTLQDQSLQNRS